MSESDDIPATTSDLGETIGSDPDPDIIEQFEKAAANRGAVDRDLMPDRLCQAVVDVLDVDAAAISVYLGGDVAVPVGANDPVASMGEALQFTVREEPCFESYRTRCPVLIADVRDQQSPIWRRWPLYAAALAQNTAFHGVFAYPLVNNGVALGSLSLYRLARGYPQDLGAAAAVATRIADLLSADLFTSADRKPVTHWLDSPTGRRRRLVWQAQGLTAQANRLTPGQAIDLLRALAYTEDRSLDDLAEDIISGRLPVPDLPSDP